MSDPADSRPTAETVPDAATAAADAPPWTRLLLEAGPLIVFFVVNRFSGIMIGTAVFVVATLVSLVLSRKLENRWPLMPLISCFFVVLFGGMTLLLADDVWIKLKPTVVNLLFATILLGGLAAGRLFLPLLMSGLFDLTERGWRLLTLRWGLFFVVLAILNEVVWRNFSTDFWVGFKLWGLFPLALIFGAAQLPLLMKYQVDGSAPGKEKA